MDIPLTDDIKDHPQYPYLLSTDYIDRVFPSPLRVNPLDTEQEAWESRKVHARKLKEIFPKAFTFMCFQHAVLEGMDLRTIADLYGCSHVYIFKKLNSIKKPPD